MTLHPERYSTSGVVARKAGVVIHDSESNDDTHDTLLRLLSQPGDRIIEGSNPPRKYGSGYHAITNGLGGYTEVATAQMGPYHAPPLNKTFWGICMPGRANQTREQWLDPLSRAHIRGVAQYVVDKARLDGFPLHDLTVAELKAAGHGYCSHAEVSAAWHQTDHTDPGISFPWDVLAADIAALTTPAPAPPQEDEVKTLHVYVPGDKARAEAIVQIRMDGFNDPAEVAPVSRVLGAEKRALSAVDYDALLHAAS